MGKEREKQHLDVLLSYQAKMKKYTQDISSLQSSAHSTPNTVQQLPLYSKVFPSPPSSYLPFPLSVHPPTSGGLLQFSNLFCLSGQLAQFCQGQHGSKLVMDRLREGTDPERDLVRKELGLPMSLGSILETGNRHCLQVVLTLVETDMRTRVEVVGQLEMKTGDIMRLEGGEEFKQRVVEVVKLMN